MSIRAPPAAILGDVLAAAQAPAGGIQRRQRERLVKLLQAAQATPFYRRAWCGMDPLAVPLTALPAIGKARWMAHFGQALTDPRITLAGVREFCADPARIGRRYRDAYWVWESSGSSGQPGVYVQDETAMAVYDALESTRRQSPRPWVRLFDPFYLGERLAFVGATGGHFASHVSLQRLRAANPWLAATWQCFSILQATSALVAQLDAFAPSILATYPTAGALLAEEARQGHLRARPREVWTGGETLTPALRQRIEQGLGCALRNSYGASEFLPIAWECGRGHLHVNADWVILEPVDAQNRPVAAGQRSHTTLLTNLANQLQPLVRLDIGDQIVLDSAPCPCGSALPVVDVLGRHDDVILLPGRAGRPVTLLPLALTTLLEDEAGLFDFQLSQTGERSLRLTLGPMAAPDAALAQRCRSLLLSFAASQGAHGVRVSVQVRAALALGGSGKLKRIVGLASDAAPAAVEALDSG